MSENESSDKSQKPNEGATFMERIAETLDGAARSSTVYGDPVERDGVTVIPVAKVQYGFGGGGGEGKGHAGDHGEGAGGGGGVVAKPIGYIEMKNGESTFRPIHDRTSLALLIAAGGVAGMLTFRGIAKLLHHKEEIGA